MLLQRSSPEGVCVHACICVCVITHMIKATMIITLQLMIIFFIKLKTWIIATLSNLTNTWMETSGQATSYLHMYHKYILNMNNHCLNNLSHPLICPSGSMPVQRWTSGAAELSCTPCSVALCPLTMSMFPRCLRRSEEASSTSQSTWHALWLHCWCTCYRLTPWREPPSKTSGNHFILSDQVTFILHRMFL